MVETMSWRVGRNSLETWWPRFLPRLAVIDLRRMMMRRCWMLSLPWFRKTFVKLHFWIPDYTPSHELFLLAISYDKIKWPDKPLPQTCGVLVPLVWGNRSKLFSCSTRVILVRWVPSCTMWRVKILPAKCPPANVCLPCWRNFREVHMLCGRVDKAATCCFQRRSKSCIGAFTVLHPGGPQRKVRLMEKRNSSQYHFQRNLVKKDLSPQKLRRFDNLISISTIFFWALWVFCWAEVGVLIGNLSAALPSKRPQTYRIFLTGLIHRDSRYRYSNAIRFRSVCKKQTAAPQAVSMAWASFAMYRRS